MIEEECDNSSGSDEFFVDDPALDFLLYKKMTQDDSQKKSNSGCFGFFVCIVICLGSAMYHFF